MKYSLLIISFICLAGCGYTLRGSGSDLPPDVKRIAIPFVENNSTETGLTSIVTEALRDQFEKFGTFAIVEESEEPDAILQAKILSVNRQTGTMTAKTQAATQTETTLTLSAEIRRPSGQLLWQASRMKIAKSVAADRGSVVTTSADFATSTGGASDLGKLGDREISRSQEQYALENLAEQAAQQIYDDAVTPDF